MSRIFRFSVWLYLVLIFSVAGETHARDVITNIPNAVLAGEGFKALKHTPDGGLALLYWQTKYGLNEDDFEDDAPHHYFTNLIYRHKANGGEWVEEVVATAQDLDWETLYNGFRHPVETRDFTNASLLIGPNGETHVLARLSGFGGSEFVHFVRTEGVWQRQEIIEGPCCDEDDSQEMYMAAEIDREGFLHVIMNLSGQLHYGTNKSGVWDWTIAVDNFKYVNHYFPNGSLVDDTPNLYTMFYLPRYVSLAIDSDGFAHIGYCPEFKQFYDFGGPIRQTSQYNYATNKSGEWRREVVSRPADNSSDAGYGGSIAINPMTNNPAIATFYVARADTGSARGAKLLFHEKVNSKWKTTTVASSADGYIAKDGNLGTGFAPMLQYNQQGLPQIAFTDFASQHFSKGADEFAGQIRDARRDSKGKWSTRTIYRQSNPLVNGLIYPAISVSASRLAYAGTVIKTTLSGERVVKNNYKVVMIEK